MSTDDQIGAELLAEARAQLQACHRKVLHCVAQLDDAQLWHRAGEGFSSIANLLLHLEGNIHQRILSLIGGEPDRRNRDQEFAERGPIATAELVARFDDTLRRTDALLAELPPERLLDTRQYPMLRGRVEGSFVVLIVHTLVHLGGHTQEIVSLTRHQLGDRYRFMQSTSK